MASHPFENPEVLQMPYAVHAMQTYTMLRQRPAKPESRAFLTAAWLLSMQLMPVEEALEKHGRDVQELGPVMRERWALGYVFGVAARALDEAGVSRESHSAEDLILQMHRLALREPEERACTKLSKAALPWPEYAAGMLAGGQDVRSIADEELGTQLTAFVLARLGLRA